MAIKLTKTELRAQQFRLDQLRKYLPTLQLKKALLQMEVSQATHEIEQLRALFEIEEERVKNFASLLSDKSASDLFSAVTIIEVEKSHENIAGVEIPIFENVRFREASYALFDSPAWMEPATEGVRDLLIVREKVRIAKEKKKRLEKELRDVSIRVNLFEKILIPRAQQNIKKIRIFLGDLQLTAVAQAKVAKKKILQRMALR
ncbi:MAG: V-type ATP synthase subunit D [Chlamydiales bacterium]